MALLSLESPAELSQFLNTSIFQLEEIINAPHYKHYVIKKKRGGERHIFAPDNRLKKIQKRLNYFLQAWYLWIKPPEVTRIKIVRIEVAGNFYIELNCRSISLINS